MLGFIGEASGFLWDAFKKIKGVTPFVVCRTIIMFSDLCSKLTHTDTTSTSG